MNVYVPNRIWSNALKIAALICIIQGICIITEPFLEKKQIKQVCVNKEVNFQQKTGTYSYRIDFNKGHQYVDPDVYSEIMIGDSVLFNCTPLHYTIVEFTLHDNIRIKNLRNYYASIGWGIFFVIMGALLFILKFKKNEHLVIWSFLIGVVLIFVLSDFSKIIKGNPFGASSINVVTNKLKPNAVQSIQADSANSVLEDDLMLKIINKDIKTPMDSTLAIRCFNYMKVNYSLMIKIIDSKLSSNKEMAQVAMANYIICTNSIELLEKSSGVLTKSTRNEIKGYKSKLEPVSLRIFDLYQSSLK